MKLIELLRILCSEQRGADMSDRPSTFEPISASGLMASRRPTVLRRTLGAMALLILSAGLAMWCPLRCDATARDLDGRYANSPLKAWFESLRSAKGPCCSDADGTALSDIDWEMQDGRYRVRIEGLWWDVPEDAVVAGPNRAGRTMVWPVYYRQLDKVLRIEVRCFLPGSMT